MTGEQLYVSHAPGDLELVQELFSTVKNFPVGVHIALEEIESGRSRTRLTGRISNSDVVAVVLTERSASNQWVNQEIGYAQAKGIPLLPLYDHEQLRSGFVSDIEGVTIDRQNLSVTVFNLLCRLRSELAPLGALSVPTGTSSSRVPVRGVRTRSHSRSTAIRRNSGNCTGAVGTFRQTVRNVTHDTTSIRERLDSLVVRTAVRSLGSDATSPYSCWSRS